MYKGAGQLNSAVEEPFSPRPVPPRLLLELDPASHVFFSNLADTLLFRRAPQIEISSRPAPFWPDVFVSSRLPWRQFLESAAIHVLVLGVAWGASRALALRPQLITRAPLRNEDVIYYSPSEYLQPIDTGKAEAAENQKGEPEFAKQPIISVPREADNHSQTIITPPNIKLDHDIAVPNIVAWNGPAPAPPLPSGSDRRSLDVTPSIVAPAPEVTEATTRRPETQQESVVAPAPQLSGTSTRRVELSAADVIAPPPNMPRDVRLGDVNIGRSEVVAPAPQLPVQSQRTLGDIATLASQQTKIVPPPPSVQNVSGFGRRGGGTGVTTSAGAVPPSPSVQGVRGMHSAAGVTSAQPSVVAPPPTIAGSAGSSNAGRQLIALSLHPAVGAPPADVAGNRRGSFAATPEGKPGAAGTPEIAGRSAGSHGAGGGVGSGHDTGLPAGIHVGPGPNDAPGSTAASDRGGGTGSDQARGAAKTDDKKLIADNRPMRVTVSPRAIESPNAPSAVERQVFGDRKSYGMVLNMPNLNSGGGSWIIRFAELKESVAAAQGSLTAPEATHKVDPGYPLELMRQNVRGTVTLYAVIHSDGTVGDVKVLESPDERLDGFARSALLRWHFRPAMKNGVAVALEAVVRIPFQPAAGW